jgi:hypothetical protein
MRKGHNVLLPTVIQTVVAGNSVTSMAVALLTIAVDHSASAQRKSLVTTTRYQLHCIQLSSYWLHNLLRPGRRKFHRYTLCCDNVK